MTSEMPTDAVSVLRMYSLDRAKFPDRLKARLERVQGVHSIEIDYVHDTVEIKYDPKTLTHERLKEEIHRMAK